jgi:hypothetical protein
LRRFKLPNWRWRGKSNDPLALAFVYAKSGDLEKAYRELDEHGPRLDNEENEKLRLRLAVAAESA